VGSCRVALPGAPELTSAIRTADGGRPRLATLLCALRIRNVEPHEQKRPDHPVGQGAVLG